MKRNVDVEGLYSFAPNKESPDLIKSTIEWFVNDTDKPKTNGDNVLCLEVRGNWREPVYVIQDKREPNKFYMGWKRECDKVWGKVPELAIRSSN